MDAKDGSNPTFGGRFIRRVLRHVLFLAATSLPLPSPDPAFGEEADYITVARNFLLYHRVEKNILSTLVLEGNDLAPLLPEVVFGYLVNLEGGGYILVSSSRALTPVKAYSFRADFGTLPEAYKRFLFLEMEYNARTVGAPERTLAAMGENEGRWDFLLNLRDMKLPLEYVPDTHLLTTKWDQGYPYNRFLPRLDGERVAAGCLNVAMAQIMKYHGHPSRGNGVALHTWEGLTLEAVLYRPYNWENAPDVPGAATPSFMVDEVALLIRDLGIVNRTAFGGTSSPSVFREKVLVEYFGYSDHLASLDNTDETLFFGTLKGEIDAMRPVLLQFPGHMAVADGYSSNETGKEIHVNMGWGGHDDDYYFLDRVVQAGGYEFQPDLAITFNIRPCTGPDCFVNLEDQDILEGSTIEGRFDSAGDVDRFEVYLKGDTTLGGTRGYANQAFYISLHDSARTLIDSSNEAMVHTLDAGRYTVGISLCSDETGGCYGDDPSFDAYTVTVATDAMTEAEKAAVDASLEVPPEIHNSFRDLVLSGTSPAPYGVLIDARDENGDLVTLEVRNTNPAAAAVSLEGNVLSVTPVQGASGTATRVTVLASDGEKGTSESFVVMVSDRAVSFGREFVVSGVFEGQGDEDAHPVILEGGCTIEGYNGYSEQAFYASVRDGADVVVVSPVNGTINHTFTGDLYSLRASLSSPGSYYEYIPGENDQYWLTVSCPDADEGAETVAGLLGIDLSGTDFHPGDVDDDGAVTLADAVLCLQILTGAAEGPPGCLEADVNGDDRIGLEEAVYVLGREAGLRE